MDGPMEDPFGGPVESPVEAPVEWPIDGPMGGAIELHDGLEGDVLLSLDLLDGQLLLPGQGLVHRGDEHRNGGHHGREDLVNTLGEDLEDLLPAVRGFRLTAHGCLRDVDVVSLSRRGAPGQSGWSPG